MKDTLEEALDAALTPGPVTVERGGVRATVEVADVDRIGVSIRGLRVAGGQRDADRIAEALAPVERFRVVETAPELGGAVLRSPVRRGEFYEARADGDGVGLERRRITPGGRESVPFALTREQLRRVVEGLGS
mgnify:CR=1 FL=1